MHHSTPRTAFVTGAASGIGHAMARAFSAAGYQLFLADRNRESLEATAEALGGTLEIMPLDVSDEAACRQAVAAAQARFGTVDTLVNAAGIYKAAAFLNHTVADYQKMLEVNLYGAIHLLQAALPAMRERGFGRVVNIASTAGKWGGANQSAYSVSKHAVIGLTRCLALEFASSGITVNAICPGPVNTPMLENLYREQAGASGKTPEQVRAAMLGKIPLGRPVEPGEIAALALFLASDAAGAITAQSYVVDGGILQI